MTHVSTRWHLKDRPPLWQLPKRLFSPMRRDTAEKAINSALDVAIVQAAKDIFRYETKGEFRPGEKLFNPMEDEMRRQLITLSEKGIGRSWPIPLPQNFSRGWEEERDRQRARNEEMRAIEDHNRIKRENRAIVLKKANLSVPLFRFAIPPVIGVTPDAGTTSDEVPETPAPSATADEVTK